MPELLTITYPKGIEQKTKEELATVDGPEAAVSDKAAKLDEANKCRQQQQARQRSQETQSGLQGKTSDGWPSLTETAWKQVQEPRGERPLAWSLSNWVDLPNSEKALNFSR